MQELPSLTPYLIRAFYEWCVDNSFTPQIAVEVKPEDVAVQLPREYVVNDEVVFNISPSACAELNMDNDAVSFAARFAGRKENIWIPIGNIKAIFARENGSGIPFEVKREVQTPKPQSPGFKKV